MENNQQNKSERNTSTSSSDSAFNNQQPGQQLPLEDAAVQTLNPDEVKGQEHHSESSRPSAENETLGTP